jgi:hypothetical protein
MTMNVPIAQTGFRRKELPLPAGNSFVRLITAKAVARLNRETPQMVAARMWPSDRIVTEILERATAAPAMTSVAGWAAELAQRRIHDALQALGPASAGAEIFRHVMVLSFDGAGSISAPGFVAEFGNAGFVAEGNPIPVRQLASTAVLLQTHKLAALSVLSREMVTGSNAEVLIGDTLARAAGRMLDEVLFDANPETADRPAGLRNGIAAKTPSATADTSMAFIEDVATLINALAPVAGNGPYIIVTSPGRAVSMSLRFVNEADQITVIGSSAVVNDVLAIAPQTLVAALDPEPQVEAATAATLHMDTAPGPVGTASPHKSMFQTESVALKMRWPVTWALRDARGFAWLTPTAWK